MLHNIFRVLPIFCLFFAFEVVAQYQLDGLDLSQSNDAWFIEKIGIGNTAIVSGKYYRSVVQSRTTHNFFISRGWKKGQVKFRDKIYPNIDLMYILDDDLLLTNNPKNINTFNDPIILDKRQIEWFIIEDILFEFRNDLDKFQPGFYEVITQNAFFNMFVQRKKIAEVVNGEVKYVERNKVIINQSANSFKCNSSRSLVKLFPEIAKPLKLYLSSNKLRKLDEVSHYQLESLAEKMVELLAKTQ